MLTYGARLVQRYESLSVTRLLNSRANYRDSCYTWSMPLGMAVGGLQMVWNRTEHIMDPI